MTDATVIQDYKNLEESLRLHDLGVNLVHKGFEIVTLKGNSRVLWLPSLRDVGVFLNGANAVLKEQDTIVRATQQGNTCAACGRRELKVIKGGAKAVYLYAIDTLEGPWPEGEEIIKTSTQYAYLYARGVLKGPWPEGEGVIKTSAQYAYLYARHILKGPWPEAEGIIKTSARYAYLYAGCVLKGPWPEGEEIIKTNAAYWEYYQYFLESLKGTN